MSDSDLINVNLQCKLILINTVYDYVFVFTLFTPCPHYLHHNHDTPLSHTSPYSSRLPPPPLVLMSSILSHPFSSACSSSILCLLIRYFVLCVVSFLSLCFPFVIHPPLSISFCLFIFVLFVFIILDIASLTASVHAPSGSVPAQTQFPWQQILPQLQVIYPFPPPRRVVFHLHLNHMFIIVNHVC